ncbi:replication factor A protein 3 [Hyaloraphidium curvatum]|nr:replication factor A protein 3 [Hyaloraphidium curvatum]
MMATDAGAGPAPRINSSLMNDHRGRTVRLVGRRLPHPSQDMLLLEASDRGQVEVRINQHEHYCNTQYVEVVGQVESNGKGILAYAVTEFGDNFDLVTYDKLVNLRLQHAEIFG